MKKKEKKELKKKLNGTIIKVLTTNNSILIAKIEKIIKKSVKESTIKSKKKITPKEKTIVAA